MHLSTLFESRDNLTIDIKSCLSSERLDAFKGHSRELFKCLALHELMLISHPPLSEEGIEAGIDKLEGKSELYLIAYHCERPVGFLVTCKENPKAIMAMHVVDKYRKKGIGGLLVNQLRRITQIDTIEVDCLVVNRVAMAFYRKLGFVFDSADVLSRGKLTTR